MADRSEAVRALVEHFLETAPLYRRLSLELPPSLRAIYPDVLTIRCEICRDLRPFRDPDPPKDAPLEAGLHTVDLLCTGCEKQRFVCWFEVEPDRSSIRKVGQVPPWSTSVPAYMATAFGDDVDDLERARTCLAQNHGLAACSYLRRAIGNQIGGLLELLAGAQEETGARLEVLDNLRRAIEAPTPIEKARLAARYTPSNLIVEGRNPFEIVHDFLSAEIHTEGENECTEIAQVVLASIEFIVRELTRQRQSREEFLREVGPIPERLARRPLTAPQKIDWEAYRRKQEEERRLAVVPMRSRSRGEGPA